MRSRLTLGAVLTVVLLQLAEATPTPIPGGGPVSIETSLFRAFAAVVPFVTPIVIAVVAALFRAQGQLRDRIDEVADAQTVFAGEINGRLEVHERSLRTFDKVIEARVLKTFEQANPITEDEAALFRTIRERGADSAQIADEQLEQAIAVLVHELDTGQIPEVKQSDAKLAIAFLGAALTRRRATADVEERRTVMVQQASHRRRRAWWEVF